MKNDNNRRFPLQANSPKAAMQELITLLQKFFPAVPTEQSSIDLLSARASLFRILITDNWGPKIFWGNGIKSLNMLNDQVLT